MPKRSSLFDRLMILGIVLLVAAPVLYWLISPTSWSYASALENHKKGEFELAEEQYREILKSKPNHTLALFRLGELAYRKQDFEAALSFADQAMTIAESHQKPSIINLQTNSLIALDRKEASVKSIAQLYEFTSLPKNFETLDAGELLPFMKNPSNRHFLNSLAYVLAINNVDLSQAEKYISVVIRHFEQETDQARLTAAYLFERAGSHEKAYAQLKQMVTELETKGKERTAVMAGIAKQIKMLLSKSNGQPNIEDAERLRDLEMKGNYKTLFMGYNRLKQLAAQLNNGEEERYSAALEKFRTDYITEENCRIDIDDRKFLQYAYELQHYYDTRAVVRLRMGDVWAAKSIGQRLKDVNKFIKSSEKAESNYQNGYADLMKSIDVKNAVEIFQEKYPENSLLISLPNDLTSRERDENRIQAIEHYHRFLLLISLERLDEAQVYHDRVLELGFEPGPLLF